MPPPSQVTQGTGRASLGPFIANKRYVLCMVTDGTGRRAFWVEWPVGAALCLDSTGMPQVLPVAPAGGLLPAALGVPGAVSKAAALTAPAATAVTNNTGGSILGVLPAIVGAVYATDAPAIKNAISTLTAAHNLLTARMEDLIAKLQTAGVQT